MSEREKFEKAFRAKFPHYGEAKSLLALIDPRIGRDTYADAGVQNMYEGFQLGRRSLAEEVPVIEIEECLIGLPSTEMLDRSLSFLHTLSQIKEGK